MPNGGFRMVVSALKTYGYEPDAHVVDTFTKYRRTHNDGVFDAYTADLRRCRNSHILTGLPDAYGRGRIIGDYRRVALYGVKRLIERKQEEKRDLDGCQSTDDIIRDREETGMDIGPTLEFARRLATRRRPIWVRFVLVPGLTDDPADLARIARFAADLGTVERVDVLPFHQMGRFKWERLGLEYSLEDTAPPTAEAIERACAVFREEGLKVY